MDAYTLGDQKMRSATANEKNSAVKFSNPESIPGQDFLSLATECKK